MLKKKLLQTASSVDHSVKKRRSNDDLLDLSAESCSVSEKSKYFPNLDGTDQKLLDVQAELNSRLRTLTFLPPVAYVYNPVEYASKPNESYVRKYLKGFKKILFIGMNPGPFGMCQTGVPFGEIKSVRDWLGIEEEVGKPEIECPKRKISGFACTRTEVSGDRFWNLFKKLCVTPEKFFENAFVYNYCPLAFMKKDGGNLTPRDLKDVKELEEICDDYYAKVIKLLAPEVIVGIGEYAEKRSTVVVKRNNITNVRILRLPHPSPRASNNQNWPEKATSFLENNSLMQFFV